MELVRTREVLSCLLFLTQELGEQTEIIADHPAVLEHGAYRDALAIGCELCDQGRRVRLVLEHGVGLSQHAQGPEIAVQHRHACELCRAYALQKLACGRRVTELRTAEGHEDLYAIDKARASARWQLRKRH